MGRISKTPPFQYYYVYYLFNNLNRCNCLISGVTTVSEEQLTTAMPGWYMTITQVWATMFVLPAVIALLGSYMICREEQDDTLKSLRLIPVNETKLTTAKMIVALVF